MSIGSNLRRLWGQISNPTAAGMLDGSWHKVESSWITAAKYDPTAKTLWLRTKQNREYAWVQNLDREEARAFLRSWSKGKFVWRHWPPGMGKTHTGRRKRRL